MSITKKTLTGERKWFLDARFGVFIHFGLYSLHGGGENAFARGIMPKAKYEQMMQRFNPSKFNADEWTDIAKTGGARYLVFTAKHGEGFCLWDSRYTSYKITKTPFGRDLLGELAVACHKKGLRFGVYYSIIDWHSQDSAGGLSEIKNYPEYVEAQLRELMTKYGRIDLVWFDGSDKRIDVSFMAKMADMIHRLQPSSVINERGIAGCPRIYNPKRDYVTPERYIPEIQGEHYPVECCDAMGQLSWGYHKSERFWSAPELIKRLSRVAGLNGNYLLNLEPGPNGRIRPECVERMQAMGKWLKKNEEAVFNIHPCLLKPREGYPSVLHDARIRDHLPVIGLATRRGNCVYLHLYSWPIGDTVLVKHVSGKVRQVKLLGSKSRLSVCPGKEIVVCVPTESCGNGLLIKGLPAEPPFPATMIIKIVFSPGMSIDQKAITAEETRITMVFPEETVYLSPKSSVCRSGDGVPMLHYFKDEDGVDRFCWFGRFDQQIVWHLDVAAKGKYRVVLESEKIKGTALCLKVAGQKLGIKFNETERKIGRHVIGKISLPAGKQTLNLVLAELGAEWYFPFITNVILSPLC